MRKLFPFLQRVNLSEHAKHAALAAYTPSIAVQGLVRGIDNIRHDVFLSPRFTELVRLHIQRLISNYGNVLDLVQPVEEPGMRRTQPPGATTLRFAAMRTADPADYKRSLAELHVAALNRAKAENDVNIDLLARLAVIKFQRAEVIAQFAQVLERCRTKLKGFEGPRMQATGKAVEMRERFWQFHVGKKTILRKVGQDLFQTMRDVEKETLSRMRRSLFGDEAAAQYELFTNRLLYTEDGRDDYINAEHYVMLGNFERDPDRFQTMQDIAINFIKSLNVIDGADEQIDGILSAPDNAQELVGGGTPDESSEAGRSQKVLLNAWMEMLERESVMDHVVASYEVVPLLPQYSPPINAQQLKNALISRTERKRVEALLEDHGKISPAGLNGAVKKMEACRGGERAKIAGRFLRDFMRYHRDLRRFEALISAMDAVNLIGNEKLRELSVINNTLYEFLLPEEQKPAEEKIIRHVVLKADVRDSTTLTRLLSERGLNPASYFSLNFYEPINKLLPKYAATKVFIEGDAIILALFEREGEAPLAVAKTCVLAREMIEIVRAYNEQSQKQGLPTLELGIGISYQDSAPMYLMDGANRIMISRALNESDRLSSCSKGARKYLAGRPSAFNVYSFQTVEEEDTGGNLDEFLVRYNIGGVNMNEAAFRKLRQEIALQAIQPKVPPLWPGEQVVLYSGVVAVAPGVFHKLVIREADIPHVDPRELKVKNWTGHKYYEVCTNQSIYDLVERSPAARAAVGD